MTVNRSVSDEDMFAEMVVPGAVWLTTGFKGGGKSHTAMAVCERLVEGAYPKVGKVFLLTNIIFLKKYAGDRYETETPENVIHVETMEDTFQEIARLLREYGRDIKIMLVLDEAQNFIGGDSNFTNASIMMKEFLGTIRKYRLIVWFLCPSAQAIGPAFRNWLNDPKYPGNVTCKWKKDLAWNEEFIRKNHLEGVSPKQLMVVKNYDSKARVIQIPVTPWTRTKEEISPGEYCYDHESSATFYVGHVDPKEGGFDWEDFNRRLGGVPSTRIVETIESYFGMQRQREEEAASEPPLDDASMALLDAAVRMKDASDWSWQKIADIVGMPRTTLTSRLQTAGMWKPEWDRRQKPTGRGRPDAASDASVQQSAPFVQQKTHRKTPVEQDDSSAGCTKVYRQSAEVASSFDDGQIGGSKSPAIYISRPPSGNGVFRDPFFVNEGNEIPVDGGAIRAPSTAPSSRPEKGGDAPLPPRRVGSDIGEDVGGIS